MGQLQKIIKESGLSNYRISKLSGVSQSTLSRIVNDEKYQTSNDKAFKIEKAIRNYNK